MTALREHGVTLVLDAYTEQHKLLCMYMQVRVPQPLLPSVSVRVPTPRAWFKVNVTFNGNFDGGKTTTWHIVCVSIAQSETSRCQRQGVFLP